MRTLTYKIESEFDGAKVRDVLTKRFLISGGLCSKLKRRKNGILVNGFPSYVIVPVHTGDLVSVIVSDFIKDPHIQPISYPIDIIYEDEDLLVINKPAGLAVHPSRDPKEATLENALAYYLGPDENPHPVSRLDKDTTGLIMIAKSGWAHSVMKTVQHAEQMQKNYLAIVKGCPSQKSGIIDAPIGLLEGSKYQHVVRDDGLPSVSEYQVISTLNDLSLVLLTLHTGRTHQLRVHMAYMGCPLLGDWLYGVRDSRISRPALHSYYLSFTHPLTNRVIDLSAPYPEDMKQVFPYALYSDSTLLRHS